MTPHSQELARTAARQTTSPWTDIYRPAQTVHEDATPSFESRFNDDDQQPTHTALSDAYTN